MQDERTPLPSRQILHINVSNQNMLLLVFAYVHSIHRECYMYMRDAKCASSTLYSGGRRWCIIEKVGVEFDPHILIPVFGFLLYELLYENTLYSAMWFTTKVDSFLWTLNTEQKRIYRNTSVIFSLYVFNKETCGCCWYYHKKTFLRWGHLLENVK